MEESQVITVPPVAVPEPSNPAQNINQILGDSLWNVKPTTPEPAPLNPPNPAPDPIVNNNPEPEVQTIELGEYFKEHYGVSPEELKEKWNKWKDYDANPPAPTVQEFKYENEESERFHQLIKEGKKEDVWRYLDQQRQIERLETLQVSSAAEATEILKSNLRFKHSDLKSEQIERLFERQYGMPSKPVQGNMDDDDFAIEINNWEKQVQQREQDMIIDATIAKPDFAKYKSNIVLPDIQRNDPPASQVDQKALEDNKAFVDNYLASVRSNYQNFKGYSVTAKDGDVELPISYQITSEELAASKQTLENTNVYSFFDNRWFDEKGNPNVTLIQEDLYLLANRARIFQKIANESSAQRYLHHVKKQNNINLTSVNNAPAPAANVDTRTESERLGDALWKKR